MPLGNGASEGPIQTWRMDVFVQMTLQSLLKWDLTRKSTDGPGAKGEWTKSSQADSESFCRIETPLEVGVIESSGGRHRHPSWRVLKP